MKVLRSSQERAERAVEVAKLKARKLKEIDRLKELELAQEQIFLNSEFNKEAVMKRIREDAMKIRIYDKREVPIESVFDNTIAAIRRRIESQQNASHIIEFKRVWQVKNEQKRNQVIEIERKIKEHIRKYSQEKLIHMQQDKIQDRHNTQLRLSQAQRRLSQLEEAEKKMMQKLSNTRALEYIHIRTSAQMLKAIESKRSPSSISHASSGSRQMERPQKIHKSSFDDYPVE
eukprot:TRINITY_DN9784_c0_g1_i1.p2 TRINITY_DN9784_c0_g1~~TRINITY_DN9784_c0_g1_i1.p2  ORF type:complete len:231 (-),score=73.58 TRINITY_DN9784_c0_g1_i1:126-818(-)